MAKNFFEDNPLGWNITKAKPDNADTKIESKDAEPTTIKRAKGRPKKKQGNYKKINISMEEKLINQLKEKADAECGGNVTMLINKLLSEVLN